MRVNEFDFDLPNERIALRPAIPRDASRMLVINEQGTGDIQNAMFVDLTKYLKPGDALVFNDTKVIPAQLEGTRHRIINGQDHKAKASVTLHMKVGENIWLGFAKGAKKLKSGDRLVFTGADMATLSGNVLSKGDGGEIEISFDVSGTLLDTALARVGHIPLPPYISAQRPEDQQDRTDYQTVYANKKGAVAAPTAGLHFTDALIANLESHGISCHFVTLHVGAGTFLPVKVEDTEDHKMHAERGSVSAETADFLNQVRAQGGRLVSVGTTSLRLLESATDDEKVIHEWNGATDIFITPGYRFRAVDALITNFHLPRSTLFMLVSAFAGVKTMRKAYEYAIENRYRFYSYGDASLLFPESTK